MDVVDRHRLHVEATTERDKRAKEAIDLLANGKNKAGIAAAKKAQQWDDKAKSLEP
jgi:hypothetical protein